MAQWTKAYLGYFFYYMVTSLESCAGLNNEKSEALSILIALMSRDC